MVDITDLQQHLYTARKDTSDKKSVLLSLVGGNMETRLLALAGEHLISLQLVQNPPPASKQQQAVQALGKAQTMIKEQIKDISKDKLKSMASSFFQKSKAKFWGGFGTAPLPHQDPSEVPELSNHDLNPYK
jgi:hypothetical protein